MKILNTSQLRQCLNERDLPAPLDPRGKHLTVGTAMLHNDCEVRTMCMVKLTGWDYEWDALINIPLDLYNRLPEPKEE